MKKLKSRKKISLITDLLIVIILAVVFSVAFIPESITPIYGGDKSNVIYNGNKDNKNVSLMFNVYENTDVVYGILDVLKDYGAKATFFVGGCWADDNADVLKKILSEGHELGNHGYFHKDHKLLSYDKNREEIYLTDLIVTALCGAKMTLFAPPSGSFSNDTVNCAYDLGYKVIMWSKDTIDWRDSEKDKIIARATQNLTNGDLVLLHPKTHTLSALPEILDFYVKSGFGTVTVSENIKDV